MHVTRSHTRNIECHIYPLFRIMLFATVAAVAFSERAEGGEIGIATYAWWFGANEQWTHITSNNEQVIFSIYKRSMTQFTFHFVVLYLFIQSFFLFCSVRVRVTKRKNVHFCLWFRVCVRARAVRDFFPIPHTIRFLYIISFEFDSIYMLRI